MNFFQCRKLWNDLHKKKTNLERPSLCFHKCLQNQRLNMKAGITKISPKSHFPKKIWEHHEFFWWSGTLRIFGVSNQKKIEQHRVPIAIILIRIQVKQLMAAEQPLVAENSFAEQTEKSPPFFEFRNTKHILLLPHSQQRDILKSFETAPTRWLHSD